MGNKPLPFDYQYALAAVLYRKLSKSDPSLAKFLHRLAGFMHYCFSNIIPENGKTSRDGIQFNRAHFIISSPSEDFLRPFVEGLLINPGFNIRGVRMIVEAVEILPERKLGGKETLKTLSPIFVKTARDVNGQRKEWELYPTDGKFYENLHGNLVQRYEDFYGHGPRQDHFEVVKVHWTKPKRVMINGTPRRCSLMEFDLDASEELMRFGYEAGLGEKNAMGFGCVEVKENIREQVLLSH